MFVADANCAHVAIKWFGIGIGNDFECLAPTVFCGGAGVFEEEAAQSFSDEGRVDPEMLQASGSGIEEFQTVKAEDLRLATADEEMVLLNVARKNGEFCAPMIEPFFWIAPMRFGADGESGQEFGVGTGGGTKDYVVRFLR